MTTVTVPSAPALARVPNVELMHVGEWEISTGTANFTFDDLAAAAAAVDCPAVRRPVLKLGHSDPRFDGEPAIGWVDNIGVVESGATLVGDYAGIPGWLGQVIASAYPDRSVEGQYDFRCQLGHTHPFVLTAVALLGVTAPGIGTLQSLQDIAGLYGVAAAAPDTGNSVTVTVRAAQEAPMPNPRPMQVSASVTTDDVRRAYYATAPWSVWIEEMELDPLTLLTVDDNTREYARVPVTVGAGDGEDAVSFGDPIRVIRQFVEAPADVAAGAAQRVVFASRAESRPGSVPDAGAPQTPPAIPAEGSTTPPEGAGMTPEQLRENLGLPPDASQIEVAAALAAAGHIPQAEPAETEPAPVVPVAAGAAAAETVPLDRETYDRLVTQAAAGEQARAEQLQARREQLVSAAVTDGRIPPARRHHWLGLLTADSGAETVLASLQKGTVPLTELGTDNGEDNALDLEFAGLFPQTTEA